MDFDDYETLPTNNFITHMTAGAIAGVMEHCVMYPLDSVKTRMQSLSPQVSHNSISDVLKVVVRQEGPCRLVRGMGVVVVGAAPAHALYFSCYEHLKEKLQTKTAKPFYVVAGLSGGIATLLHDAVMTPTEVVKQRLQMYNSPYKSIFDCVKRTYRKEGVRAFYRSYTTQLTMNIPFQSIHFMTYELCQSLMNKDKLYNPHAHMLSGGVAGAVAAAVTTPLDVVKTLLNTQQHRVKGMFSAFKTVYRVSGPSGYFKGLHARIIYQIPSTAICWSVYELFKYLQTRQVMDMKFSDKSVSANVSSESGDGGVSPSLRPPGLRFIESTIERASIYAKESQEEREEEEKGHAMYDWREEEVSEEDSNKPRSLFDEIERTYADTVKRNYAVLPGTQVFSSLAMPRGECQSRMDLFGDTRS